MGIFKLFFGLLLGFAALAPAWAFTSDWPIWLSLAVLSSALLASWVRTAIHCPGTAAQQHARPLSEPSADGGTRRSA